MVARAVRIPRDWVNTPPNELRPASFADAVADAGRAAGLPAARPGELGDPGRRVQRPGRGPGLHVRQRGHGLGNAADERLVRAAAPGRVFPASGVLHSICRKEPYRK